MIKMFLFLFLENYDTVINEDESISYTLKVIN